MIRGIARKEEFKSGGTEIMKKVEEERSESGTEGKGRIRREEEKKSEGNTIEELQGSKFLKVEERR